MLCYVGKCLISYTQPSSNRDRSRIRFVKFSKGKLLLRMALFAVQVWGAVFFSRLPRPLDSAERRTSSRDLVRETLLRYSYVVTCLILFRQSFSRRDRSRFCFVKSFEEQAGSWGGIVCRPSSDSIARPSLLSNRSS